MILARLPYRNRWVGGREPVHQQGGESIHNFWGVHQPFVQLTLTWETDFSLRWGPIWIEASVWICLAVLAAALFLFTRML